VSPDGLRTAIVILLDDLAPEVADARYELGNYGPNEVELHVTLLFPFVPRDRVADGVLDSLRAFFAGRPRPSFALARVAAFAEGTPPYGGVHEEIAPHATLAYPAGDESRVRARVQPLLPAACEPAHASLIEEFEPCRWRELHQLPFAEAA
jgi:2'-5' RNA ligase